MLAATISNMILQVILIAVLNIIVYFTYTTYVEQTIVETESSNVVVDLTKDLKFILSPSQMDQLRRALLPVLVPPNYSKEDEDVKQSNKTLELKTVKIMSVLVLVGLIVVISLSIKFNFNLRQFWTHNVIILISVVLIEFIFLTFFAKYYVTLDSNFVKRKLIESIVNE